MSSPCSRPTASSSASGLGSYSFADSFYKIYSDDLPVFFSTDAALQAWHRSYIAMLEELEETYLSPRLQSIVQGMAGQVPVLWSQAREPHWPTGFSMPITSWRSRGRS